MKLIELLIVVPSIQTISLYLETDSAIYVGRNVPEFYYDHTVINIIGIGLNDVAIIIAPPKEKQ